MPTAPRTSGTTSRQPRPAQRAEVVAMLQPKAKDLHPAKAVDGGYVYPDSLGPATSPGGETYVDDNTVSSGLHEGE